MKRPLIVLMLALGLAAPAAAWPMPWKVPAAPPAVERELRLTPESKVFLNGRPCRYNDVPDDAIIASALVDEDGKTILSIYFERK